MSNTEQTPEKAPALQDRLTTWAARLPRHTLAWGSLGLALVILLSVNLFASSALRGVKADVTENHLFTISKGTRSVLHDIDEPITLKLYYSKKLGEVAPSYGRYFERVRALLEQYRDISGGKLQVGFFDPEPFSDAEDRAVASGLRGIRINQEGETGYFGLTGNNSTDNSESIAFFSADREPFVEYDVTKLIYTLAHPKKRVVGLIAGVPVDGGANPMAMMGGPRQLPQQMVMEQIREFFDVKTLDQDIKEIPADVDVLMVAQPDRLTPEAAFAIDQYALSGGKVLAFVDPVAEMGRSGPMGIGPGAPAADFIKVMKAWGVDFDPKKVAADIGNARRVQFGGGARPTVTDYVAWLGLGQNALNAKDVLSGGIERLNLASPGFLTKADGATTQVVGLLHTSPRAMEIPADKFAGMPDPVGLLRGYKPGGKELMLAARVTGEAKSAFPDGPPKAEDKKDEGKAGEKKDDAPAAKPAEKGAAGTKADEKSKDAKAGKPHLTSGRINVIVIADTDLLSDQFWVDTREFLGQQVAIPNANNAALVVNALDNLSGSDALIGLRARGADNRPFTLVDNIRRDAERRYREKEQALTAKLKAAQDQLAKLEAGSEDGKLLLSDADRQTIEKFRNDMLQTRHELRDVKRALREDIDRLDGWLKFSNIALVPLLIGFGGVGWTAFQRRRRSGGKPDAGRDAA
ncbi:MAG TPA: Gldg family protein [Hyphomicrobiaceae bacterium]|nr:Gldg family protein [Hyphomicrobiaceae bacterium]